MRRWIKVKSGHFYSRCRSRSDRQGGQGDVVYPIGYSEKPVPDTSIQETDKNLVEKVRKAPDTHIFPPVRMVPTTSLWI